MLGTILRIAVAALEEISALMVMVSSLTVMRDSIKN
jgi:hypothetical protein